MARLFESRRPMTLARARLSLLLLLLLAPAAQAQTDSPPRGLKLPTFAFGAAAAADWTSTYQFLTRETGLHETNPLINGLSDRPKTLIAAGAAIDAAGVWAWNRYIGRRHPMLARAGLFVAAGFRAYLTVRNFANMRAAAAMAARTTGAGQNH